MRCSPSFSWIISCIHCFVNYGTTFFTKLPYPSTKIRHTLCGPDTLSSMSACWRLQNFFLLSNASFLCINSTCVGNFQPDSETQLLTVQFEWNGVLKSLSSTLIGVSPEFEIALYTLCFYLGEEDNHIQLGPYPVNIKCYRMGRDKIGSVFPIAESWIWCAWNDWRKTLLCVVEINIIIFHILLPIQLMCYIVKLVIFKAYNCPN